jgi:curved DNA-binding protein CbpA
LPVTHYEVLDVSKDASQGDIKAAFKKSVKTWHPDIHANPTIAEPQFRKIVEAFETLSNPTFRSVYDTELDVASYRHRPDAGIQSTPKAKPEPSESDKTNPVLSSKSPAVTYITLGSFTAVTLGGAIFTGMSGSPVALLTLLGLSVLGAIQLLYSVLRNISP